jgi:hypothetical protein
MSNPIIEAWEAASNSQRREFVVVAASRIELLRQQMDSERLPIPPDDRIRLGRRTDEAEFARLTHLLAAEADIDDINVGKLHR